LEVVPADHEDALIVAIALEQSLTEREKGNAWQAVVFQDDRFVYLREDPVQSAGDPILTTKIDIREILQYPAIPIDPVDDLPNLVAGFRFFIVARSIGDKQQRLRLQFGDALENALGQIRPIENQEGDWSSQHGATNLTSFGRNNRCHGSISKADYRSLRALVNPNLTEAAVKNLTEDHKDHEEKVSLVVCRILPRSG
jgi:hypothetical protein